MREVVTIGLRNLARRRARTALTLGMIFFGTLLIVFGVGLGEGTYADLIELATRSWAGHFQITADDYQDKPSLFTTIDDYTPLLTELEQNEEVAAVAPRVESAGLLALGNRTTGVLATGVDPIKEKKVTTVAKTVREGEWLRAGGEDEALPIILGSGVAKRLRAKLGDEVSFVGQAADGSIAADLFTVTGIMNSGMLEVDSAAVMIRLDDAQELLSLKGRIHKIVGISTSISLVDELGSSLKLPGNLHYRGWKAVMPQLAQTIKSDRAGLWLFNLILLAVVALGVTNTISMAVIERSRELGVMSALGTTPARLVGIVLGEAAWLSIIGVGAGLAAGIGVNLLTLKWEIPIGSEPISYGGIEIASMHATNTVEAVIYWPAIILLFALIAALPPAIRTARMRPAEAIREG